MTDDQRAVGISRRGALAAAVSIVTAGCSSIEPDADTVAARRRPQARVSIGYFTAQMVSTHTYEAIPGETVHQLSATLEDADSGVERIELVVFSDPTPVRTSWAVPDQIDDDRNLGENVYGRTVHDGEATFEGGDPWEVRAYGNGENWTVDEGEIPEVDDENE